MFHETIYMLLLVDLDNTIFETNSISAGSFDSATDIIRQHFAATNQGPAVIQDLWKSPFDVVAKKYAIPETVQQDFIHQLKTIDYQFDIAPYPDYPSLLQIPAPRILVTTGFTGLQLAKIAALGIQEDFEEIYIDDPALADRKHKKGIFKEIMEKRKMNASAIWVIGDSPHSELKAGKALGMPTIQRIRSTEQQSDYADYAIHSFEDLKNIW